MRLLTLKTENIRKWKQKMLNKTENQKYNIKMKRECILKIQL